MGVRNFLIDGGSGTGKTTVAEELERRGYDVVHGDRTLAYYGDPLTGEPLDPAARERAKDDIAWGYERWIWPVDRVRALVADRTHEVTFFCGSSRNSPQFIALFDAVFALEVDLETLAGRLKRRPEDEFGGRADEQALIARRHAMKVDNQKDAVSVDAARPVAQVVDDILSRCGEASG
jgi:adenylate kinase family enzyme